MGPVLPVHPQQLIALSLRALGATDDGAHPPLAV